MNLGQFEIDNYILERHSSNKCHLMHYHLLLKPEQKNDTKGIKRFTTVAEVYGAKLNEQLTKLLHNLFLQGSYYIKVIIPE